MPNKWNIRFCAALLVFWGLVWLPATSSAQIIAGDRDALAAVTHDLCHRQVAMLGESNTHGDGHTVAFKVALVERLVNECGFDSIFFEASHYEFIHLAGQLRTEQPTSVDQLAAAIGGLWKFDREFQPLLPFMVAKAQTGQVTLGGIDDQLSQLGQDYANIGMVAELTGILPDKRRQECSLTLHRRIFYDYSDAAPYSKADQSQIALCLSDMQLAAVAGKITDPVVQEERQEMISSMLRYINRDFIPGIDQNAQRDASMFQNFVWLRRHYPLRHKVIVWAATVHIAKERPTALVDRQRPNFGSFVHREYGSRAFSLGFSALMGSYSTGYRKDQRTVHDLPLAPADSLEATALRNNSVDAVYADGSALQTIGTAPGAAFTHSYETLPWHNALDGIVIFREERPPNSIQ